MRRYAILATGALTQRAGKMTHGVLAYARDEVVAVIDPTYAGKRVPDVLPHIRRDAPIVASVSEALHFAPTTLLIGVAPKGGALPDAWRGEILTALSARLEIVSGLHERLVEDPQIAQAAQASGSRIVELREPPVTPIFSGAAYDLRVPIVLTVGTDAAVGKMTASLELTQAAHARGTNAVFVPTGQIGMAIAGWGIAIDRVISDFAPGAAEQLVLEGSRQFDGETRAQLLVVEGQGGLLNPAFAPVTLALLCGAAPDALILVHQATRTTIEGYDIPIPSYREVIRLYEQTLALVKPAPVIGIALNTAGLDDARARAEIERARSETGLPADDVVRNGSHALYDTLAPRLFTKSAVRTA